MAAEFSVYNVVEGHYPPDSEQFDAYLVTGSKADSFGSDPWIQTLKEYLLERQLRPEARGDIIQLLRENNIRPTAMMDISDGLSSELLHICHQSHCGCRIYEKSIPIDYQTAVMAEEFNMNVTTCALNGGEDYELLFTCPIGDHDKLNALESKGIKQIGYITKPELGARLISRDNQEFDILAQGWNPLK